MTELWLDLRKCGESNVTSREWPEVRCLTLQLKIDPHVHTIYSDGRLTIEDALRTTKCQGLDGLAFTDHDTLKGYFKAKALDSGLLVLPGFEANTDAGHVLVLGLERLPPRVRKIRYEELIRWARRLGGLTVLAHPATNMFKLGRWMRCKPDAVEVLNASYPSSRYFVDRGLRVAERLGLPAVGGSDSHYSQTVGDAYTIVEAGNPSSGDVIEAIKAGATRFKGTVSPLSVRLRIGLRYLTPSFMKR